MHGPPKIPPLVVAYLSGKTRPQLAREVGVSVSTLARHLRVGWRQWPVGLAETWCKACGFDFWNLTFDAPGHRARLQGTQWVPLSKKARRILTALYRSAGIARPTPRQLEQMANQLAQVSNG